MTRILVTFVGITLYNSAEYTVSDTESYQTCFGQIALLRHFYEKKQQPFDAMYCFVTNRVLSPDSITSGQMTYEEIRAENERRKRSDNERPLVPNNFDFIL